MPLTLRVDGRLLEVLPLCVEVEGKCLLDVDFPADESWLVGWGCARVLLDLLGRC